MAVNITVILNAPATHVVEVEATADADTTAVIPHTLAAVPEEVMITPLVAAARLSDWIVTGIDNVNVTLTKTTAVGSGAAGVQVRMVARRANKFLHGWI